MTYKRIYLYSLLTLGLVSCSKDNSQPAPFDLGRPRVDGVFLSEVNQSDKDVKINAPIVFEKEPPADTVEIETQSSCLGSSGQKIMASRRQPFSHLSLYQLLPPEIFFNEKYEKQNGQITIPCSYMISARDKAGSIYRVIGKDHHLLDKGEGINFRFFDKEGTSYLVDQKERDIPAPGFWEEKISNLFLELEPSTTVAKVYCEGSSESTNIVPHNVHLTDLKFPKAEAPNFYSRLCRIVTLNKESFVTGVSPYFRILKYQPKVYLKTIYIPLPPARYYTDGVRASPNVLFGKSIVENTSNVDVKFQLKRSGMTKVHAYDPNLKWREEVELPTALDVFDNGSFIPPTDEYLLPANSKREVHIAFDTNVTCVNQGAHNLFFDFSGKSDKRIEFLSLAGEHLFESTLIEVENWTIPNDVREIQLFSKREPLKIPLRSPAQCSVLHAPGIH